MMAEKKKFCEYAFLALLAAAVSGCGGTSYVSPPVTVKEPGLYHKVTKGQTLWRISKIYAVEVETIASANNLADMQKIYEGQLLFIPQQDAGGFENNQREASFVWPIKGKILSFYGSQVDGVKNKGVDIKARHGEPVVASRDGKVSYVDENMKGFGKTVIIDHDDGYSTVYAYNSQILVRVGQHVRQGTVIAKAGQTGRAASPTLHFEIRKRHEPQNPFYFLQ